MKYNNIILESENSVATIRLNRPDALNALNLDLLHEFSSAVSEVEADQSVKVLVIRGQGRAFCAGSDLLLFDSLLDDLAQLNPYF